MAKRKDASPAPGERFVMEQPHVFQCLSCYWHIQGMKCRAFNYESMEPDIPIEIMSGGVVHDHPIEGDHGRQYVPKDAVPPPEDW